MEINKQLFEDVLSGKLKGTFVLRNGNTYFSADLHRNYNKFRFTHPYIIGFGSYTSKGVFSIDTTTSGFDIVYFIPETNMKENELTIEIPDGKIVDWDESKKQNKIVFKKKDTKPRSWEEYERMVLKDMGYKDNVTATINITFPDLFVKVSDYKFLQEHTAFIKLCILRKAWIGDWEPNYYMNMASNWGIEYEPNHGVFSIQNHCRTNGGGLTFPTKEIATDFMNTFKDLLETAKPLI